MLLKIYVASSWRNQYQQEIVELLRIEGHEVYDFKNPNIENKGFSWSDIDPNWKSWSSREFNLGLQHPIAQKGFKLDYDAMKWANHCVLVLPSGRSAHLEAGWFIGRSIPISIFAPISMEPELMYLLSGETVDMFDNTHSLMAHLHNIE